ANAASRQLFETALETPGERAFGIVGIATPAPSLAGWRPAGCDADRGCYTTLGEDRVIGTVIALVPDTAPANIHTSTPNARDILRHGLDETYLKNDQAREQILGHVAAFVEAFEPLQATLNDSTITAYLEWNTTADLDLHVYEYGTRAHVYTAFPESEDGGHLDADDQDGYGPEHYYAECAALKNGGDFRFSVGYFAGSGPVTARLRLKVGNSARTYTRVLEAPSGQQSLTAPTSFVVLHAKKSGDALDAKHQLIDDYEIELEPSAGTE
ncbi:MAG TPA: hypothetical protein VK509_16690, partial [Polyangiales bacterium]|nr:hypothetical protein [Polyangiales bacterium]